MNGDYSSVITARRARLCASRRLFGQRKEVAFSQSGTRLGTGGLRALLEAHIESMTSATLLYRRVEAWRKDLAWPLGEGKRTWITKKTK